VLTCETSAWKAGWKRVAGVDEAGRGPLAGPVMAAAVVFDRSLLAGAAAEQWNGLTDSKKLTPSRREFFYALLTGTPGVDWCVAEASRAEIDELNILNATHLAMRRALLGLKPAADHALVDGLPVKGLPCPHEALVKGDGLSLSIAAASVLAKVTRDHFLDDLDRRFPEYGFAAHKGYGTAAHLEALRRHGPCPEHRRSFAPVGQLELF
jgi:ribonuclease HII